MAEIAVLSSHVADLIAAGEVVERPASAAKELMENAIDAGARSVTVEIEHGGMRFLRVTDNGCGIPAGELKTAFLRHATSKLHRERDLEAIGTLGFRGEALAAISAVSRVDVVTRTAEASIGASLSLEGGVPGEVEEAGCPQGTTIIVRDIFYNTPARLKFMKKDSAEGAAVSGVVQRTALSHPEVSVRFLRDGKQELLTPGNGDLRATVYAVLGRELALGLLPLRGTEEGITVSGFLSQPSCCRGSRNSQFFFVNGRCVRSRLLMAALEQAYQNRKMVGKFPACVLHLEMRYGSVDVNVHPTKMEVKFGSERQVFDAVYHAACAALDVDRTRPRVPLGAVPRPAPGQEAGVGGQTALRVNDSTRPGSGTWQALYGFRVPAAAPERACHNRMAPEDFLPRVPAPQERPPAREPCVPEPAETAPAPEPEETVPAPEPESAAPAPQARAAAPAEAVPARAPQPPVQAEEMPARETEEPPWRVVGEAFDTYILVEQGEKLLLIDKHAAHERMNFDRMRAQDYEPMRQSLLSPLQLQPAPEEVQALLQHLPLLERFGFEVEEFGSGTLLVRGIPADLGLEEAGNALLELAGSLLSTGTADPEGARDALLHTMACKAAIKGGWKTSEEERKYIARAVVRGEVKYCPHGRPVAIELRRGQLERQFGRT